VHRRNVRAEATAVLSVVVLVTLTILVGAGFDPLADVDGAVARQAYEATFGHQGRTAFWEGVTTWGGPPVVRIVMLVVAVVLAVAGRWFLAAWLAGLVAIEAVAAPAAKLVLARPRPAWADPITSVGSTSFPSGHAAAAATAATAAVLVARHLGGGRVAQLLLLVLAVPAAVLVAASRVFLGVHYLSDVVGGALLGALLAGLTYAAAARLSAVLVRRAR
jgi:undecaprenyl-diphosphatase